jgi:hypothetical protein
MLGIGAVSGNERMPAAHETTQSVHFGAGAFMPLQDVEKEKAVPSTWRPEFAERSGTSNIPSGDARIRSGDDANTDYPKSIPYNSNRGPDDPNRGSDDAHRSVPPLSRRFRL